MLNLYALWPRSHANGPGVRLVLWFQGCTLGCPECFNLTTHAPEARWQVSTEVLITRIVAEA
jgi:anaerobic ribonucleoside-triphosphate reductase activating protein